MLDVELVSIIVVAMDCAVTLLSDFVVIAWSLLGVRHLTRVAVKL